VKFWVNFWVNFSLIKRDVNQCSFLASGLVLHIESSEKLNGNNYVCIIATGIALTTFISAIKLTFEFKTPSLIGIFWDNEVSLLRWEEKN